MAKSTSKFICQQCGATYSKWQGKCEECGEWNSLTEQLIQAVSGKTVVAKATSKGKSLSVKHIGDILKDDTSPRLKTGFSDLDAVLGGGFVPGAAILIAGQPGIGKSTLLLQIASGAGAENQVLYVSGEESASQVGIRAKRLSSQPSTHLNFAASSSAEDIAASIRDGQYKLVVIDSIQTLTIDDISSAPGTVSQITNSSNLIIQAAKQSGAAVVFVGHVTKEGSIAGPKVLEHMVDVVLQFDGDRYGGFKVVRAIKNRFGSVQEAAIFEMLEKGLEQVTNPSAALLSERKNTDGSVILATLEGTRPILVEIQALVNTTNFGYPKRTASGFDINRLNLLVAVLERRSKLVLSDKDIYINVVGGIKIDDPAADLAICLAIASAAATRRIDDDIVVFGEVGLGGEIRSAQSVDRRIAEAKKMGFKRAIGPKSNSKSSFIRGASDIRSTFIEYLQK